MNFETNVNVFKIYISTLKIKYRIGTRKYKNLKKSIV